MSTHVGKYLALLLVMFIICFFVYEMSPSIQLMDFMCDRQYVSPHFRKPAMEKGMGSPAVNGPSTLFSDMHWQGGSLENK